MSIDIEFTNKVLLYSADIFFISTSILMLVYFSLIFISIFIYTFTKNRNIQQKAKSYIEHETKEIVQLLLLMSISFGWVIARVFG